VWFGLARRETPWGRSSQRLAERLGFPAKPARIAARSGARQPVLPRQRCSTRWRIPATPYHPRRGSGQRWGWLAADEATSGVPIPPLVVSTRSLKSELSSFFTAPWGPNDVWKLDIVAQETRAKRPFQRKPAYKRGSYAANLLPCIRSFFRFHREFQALLGASFFPSVTTCLRFPLTEGKPCLSIASASIHLNELGALPPRNNH